MKNINLTIKKGEFIGLIGEVGSGKSSMLQAIMNNLLIFNSDKSQKNGIVNDLNNDIDKRSEVQKKIDYSKNDEAKIIVNGKLGYTSQIPWIQNETLRNNILFFEEYEEQKYNSILKICSLEKDIENFDGKDFIEIGEKGVNLSGGQKSRLSLARAVYNERDIYLFDDPISSLDADVGKKVFSECFMNHLKNKTRILATHNIKFLPFFDRIIWLGNNKEIIFDGKFERLINEDIYKDFVKDKNKDEEKDKGKTSKKEYQNEKNTQIENTIEEDNSNSKKIIDYETNLNLITENDISIKESSLIKTTNYDMQQNSEKKLDISKDNYKKDKVKIDINDPVYRITKDEDQETGSIKFNVFFQYFKYMGGRYIVFLVTFIMVMWISLRTLSDLWLARWTKLTDGSIPFDKNSIFPFNLKDNFSNYSVYTFLATVSICFVSIRMMILGKGTLRICKDLHTDMIDSLIKAPINLFHEKITRGIIYNRLSKDLENIKYNMYSIGGILVNLFGMLGVIFICTFFEIYTLVFIPIFMIIGMLVYSYYLRTSRELQRLDGRSRSPILNIISEAIPGGSIIRVFDKVEFYKKKFYEKVDDNYKTNLFINGTKNWYGLILDLLSTMLLTFLIVFAILFQDKFTPQSIALILTYTLNFQYLLFYFLEEFSFFQNNMISMERCLNFLSIPQEKSIISGNESFCEKELIDNRILPPEKKNFKLF